jgi:hypothetical protein
MARRAKAAKANKNDATQDATQNVDACAMHLDACLTH